MTDTPYPHCPEGIDFSGLTPTGRKKTSEPELQNFPTKPNVDFPAFVSKMQSDLVEHTVSLDFAETEARLSAMPEYRKALVCMFGDTPKAEELGDFIHKNEDFILGCGVSQMDMVALIEQVSCRHRAHGAFVVEQAAKKIENVYAYGVADIVTTRVLHDYGRSVDCYPKPIVEVGHDGRPLPRYKRNVRNKVNSNRNKKRKKR